MSLFKKQYVLFVISDSPIEAKIDPNEVRHLIEAVVDINDAPPGLGGWEICESIPENCSRSREKITAHGDTVSATIINWINNVRHSPSYYSLYLQRKDKEQKKE